ncbi:MtrAB system histidine kinase MtrB [Ruania halotolerans]|uniref:MtrAB system histidine kinase MtrB n=1 Tax=Ruania halotolerans TaxID=2897773 RepID=UPI001E593674|nr:MtrAB system histidine kinase MtrB [Ruania halotolerans]UFU07588.1 HAMP domain-containing histidine kinase [Ruania halotolerans]
MTEPVMPSGAGAPGTSDRAGAEGPGGPSRPSGAARIRLHRMRRWIRSRARFGMRAWRRSLRLRVALSTVVVGTLALALLAALLSDQVRDGLFEERRDQVLSDAAGRAEQVQDQFDSATVGTAQDAQRLADSAVGFLQQTAVDIEGVLLLPSPDPDSPVLIFAPVTDQSLRSVIEDDLRERVREEQFQQWQSVALPAVNGTSEPGIVVGAPVTIPVAGAYELYVVYSLAPEQANLELLQRVLAVGAITLVVLLLGMTWYLTRQVLDPVRQAARTAERLADGRLTERMEVRGHDELARLGASFNEMAASLQDQIERLAALSRMQQRFVSDVSHELRTPLSTVRMAAEVLYQARAQFPPTQARSAELLQNQLDRFENLLVDLLEISRFDAGAAVLDVEQLDVRDVVERVVSITDPIAAERGCTLTLDLPSRPCTADMDARRVERVLRNLLVNAIEHGEGRPIEVRVGMHERAVSILVRDHGIGMTAPEAERVFDRFWRADPARTRTLGGTGLGLAIALEDARLHGGGLDAWGSPGEGAAFRLTLPRRAGMEIGRPPLELQPIRIEREPVHTLDPAGPAALPELATPPAGQPMVPDEEGER